MRQGVLSIFRQWCGCGSRAKPCSRIASIVSISFNSQHQLGAGQRRTGKGLPAPRQGGKRKCAQRKEDGEEVTLGGWELPIFSSLVRVLAIQGARSDSVTQYGWSKVHSQKSEQKFQSPKEIHRRKLLLGDRGRTNSTAET